MNDELSVIIIKAKKGRNALQAKSFFIFNPANPDTDHYTF